MTTLLTTLARYVPDLVVHRLAADPRPPAEPSTHTVPAAVLFADISGFSVLADQLAQRGPDGAEVLSDILNGVFSQLISLIKALGGDVVTFAGDALLAIWPAIDEDMHIAIRRAAQCSLALQDIILAERVANRVKLTVRMGIGVGDVRLLHLGGVHGRWQWVVAGDPLVQAAGASYEAQPGRVVLSRETWDLVKDEYAGHFYETGSVRLDAVRSYLLPPLPGQPVALTPDMETALSTYIPRGVLARLIAGHESWLGELRRLTVLFINLPDFHTITAQLDQAQLAMHTIQSILYSYEGSVNKLSVDEKGATIVAALGLPPLVHEDDAVRGAQVALMLQAALRAEGIQSAIGMTTGHVFCGEIGSQQRREYTILGTVVNLAARLMQHAPDSILCDAATYNMAHMRILFDELAPIPIKGKPDPVAVYRPHGQVLQAIQSKPDLVGRSRERMILTTHLQAFASSRAIAGNSEKMDSPTHPAMPAPSIVIEGEAGTGKTHLLDDMQQQAHDLGITTLLVAGDAIEQTDPYYAWRGVFLHLLHIDVSMDQETQNIACLRSLERMPDLLPLAPLLNVVLPLNMPESERTRQLSGQARADATRDLLIWLLREATARQPTIIMLEDAHWLDSASWSLAAAISQTLPSVLLVIATRSLNAIPAADYQDLLRAPHIQRLVLSPLSLDDTRTLVCQRLGVTQVPRSLVVLIHEQSHGNPLFSEELVYALRDAALITVADEICQMVPEADLVHALRTSNTVQAVITRRLDCLSPSQQLTLKVASVVGQTFPYRLLYDIHPLHHTPQALVDDLNALQQFELVQRDDTAPELAYRFRHASIQEVVYNLMAFAQRRQMHRAIAEWYERTSPDRLNDLASLLAQHFERADDERALPYLMHSGDMAWDASAYQEAVSYYARASDVLQRTSAYTYSSDERAAFLLHIFSRQGQALELNAQYKQALDNYHTMEAVALQQGNRTLELAALMGRAALYVGPAATRDPINAQVVLEHALMLARRLDDRQAESRVLWSLMLLHGLHKTDPHQAMLYGEQSLKLARKLQVHEQLASTLNDISVAYRACGKLADSLAALHEARGLWEHLGNVPMQADNLAHLGLTYFLRGDYDQAMYLSQKSYNLNQTIGNLAGQANSRCAVGQIYVERGLFSDAIGMLEEAVVLGEQSGHLAAHVGARADLAWVYGNVGQVALGLKLAHLACSQAEHTLPDLQPYVLAVLTRLHVLDGNLAEAESLLHRPYRDVPLGAHTTLAPMLLALAAGELALAQQDFPAVVTEMDALCTYLDQRGMRVYKARVLYLKGWSLLAMGQQEAAHAHLRDARTEAEAQKARNSLWPILYALSQIEIQRGNCAGAAVLHQQAQDILFRLAQALPQPEVRASFLTQPHVGLVMTHQVTAIPSISIPEQMQ